MKNFLKGSLIFFMILCGIAGVITVDVRSGHMAGYPPVVDMTVKHIEVEEEIEGYALGYEVVFVVNNDMIKEKMQKFVKTN